jgi:hypothetical protein
VSTAQAVADLAKLIEGMPADEVAELEDLIADEAQAVWKPEPGPQLDAFVSPADLMLYGGAAGGGKTDLLLGLALTAHEKSLLFRRQSTDLDGLWDRLLEIGQPIQATSDSNKKKLRTKDGRTIEGGHLEKPRAEFSWQGRPHDLIGFDEGAQIPPAKMVFVMGWLRSATGHRCRAVIATNPPMGGDGAYLLEWFAPWLDPMFADKAEPGELRYAYFEGVGDQINTVWVNSDDVVEDARTGGHHVIIDGKQKEVRSRTFIPSKLDDNPYLRDTSYRAQIDSLPEPMRTQLLDGDFLAGQEDHAWQIIPTAWVYAAQDRWKRKMQELGGRQPRMLNLSCDAAMGGADNATIARLCEDALFEAMLRKPGREITDGQTLAQWMVKHRRNGADMSIDATGGWGLSAKEHLQTHMSIGCAGLIASGKSGGIAKGNNLTFLNQRAEWWWRMREALDPKEGDNVALPPDTQVTAQLTAPRWELKGTTIKVESKEEIKKRLGSSTDDADAIVQAWSRRGAMPITLPQQMDAWAETAEDDWNPYE